MSRVRTSLSVLSAAALLVLAGCSSNHHTGAADPTEASSSAAASATAAASDSAVASASTAQPTETSDAATTSDAASEESATDSAAPSSASSTEASSSSASSTDADQPAAAGTQCGTDPQDARSVVFVSGGNVACRRALEVFRAFSDRPSSPASGESVAVDGYQCRIPAVLAAAEKLTARCQETGGAGYLESRPSGTPVLAGPVADPADYTTGEEAKTAQDVNFAFTTPGDQVSCSLALKTGVACTASPGTVTLSSTGTLKTYTEGLGGVTDRGDVVDDGTVFTAAGISCQVTGEDTVHCISPTAGFTISPDGITQD